MKSIQPCSQLGLRILRRCAICAAAALALWASNGTQAQQIEFRDLPGNKPPNSPPAIHQQAPSIEGGQELAPVAYHAPVSGTVVVANYQLRRSSCQDFESNVVRAWLHRPQAEILPGGQQVRVVIPHRKTPASMTVDRSTGALSFFGPEGMAREWKHLMRTFDQPHLISDNLVVQAVDSQGISPVVLQQASYLLGIRHETVTENTLQDDPLAGQAVPGQRPGLLGIPDPTQDVVTITVYPELNLIIIRGKPEDIERVKRQLDSIAPTIELQQPQMRLIDVENIDPNQAAQLVQQVYETNFSASLGPASVVPRTYPPSLLLIGREQALARLEQLVKQVDLPPEDRPTEKNFKTYELRFMSAIDAKQRIDEYFSQTAQPTLANPPQALPVVTISDYRSNKLIVKASKAYLDQVDELLNVLDVDESGGAHAVRIFRLRNSLASDLQPVLQAAVTGNVQNGAQGFNPSPNQFAFQQQQQQQIGLGQQGANQSRQFPSPLQLMTIDREGRLVRSSILFEVRILANPNSNSLMVVGPPGAMDLVETLIDQLDRLPDAETQIKVFEIINGDAQTLLTTLQSLFATQQQAGLQAFGLGGTTPQLPLQTSGATDGSAIVNVRFAVDQRTNTIIATGPVGDLQVVESLLLRLDEEAKDKRVTYTYRLSNAPATDVATAVNEWLTNRRNLITQNPEFTGGINQARRDVYVTADTNSNTIIVTASPEYLEEVLNVLRALDRRPPVIKVAVLIAEVNLSMLEELGMDIGVQDSILYDRGLGTIGFPFNQVGIGNNNVARENLAGQALSNVGTGRTNPDLGYGGLVLSAGNESINLLLRALKDKQCLRTLSRPQLATLENVSGTLLVGARVPYVTSVNQQAFGVSNSVSFENVGVNLQLTPRVSEDGMIIMNVVAEKSTLGPEDQGTPIFVSNDGTTLRAPQILTTTASTTIMARSGQTVVFSGLIQEQKSKTRRGAPIISDLPVVGPLFRFERERATRSELLIILTPYLIYGDEDITAHNYAEMDRMHWCLSDVADMYGAINYNSNAEYSAPLIFYPDEEPVVPQSSPSSALPHK